jgi:hypothetical protein
MTQLLEQALNEVKKLPVPEQDAIASLILDELADERRWQESFAREGARGRPGRSGPARRLRPVVNSQLTSDFLA